MPTVTTMPIIPIPPLTSSKIDDSPSTTANIAKPQQTKINNIFLICAQIIDRSTKNILRTIRQAFMWLTLTFESLKHSKPIFNMIKFMHISEGSFAFKDFIKSSFILLHDIVNITKTEIKDTLWKIKTHVLDVLWNTFKVFKALAANEVYTLSAKYLIPLTTVGGAAFALNSFSRFKAQFFKVDNLLQNTPSIDKETYNKEQANISGRMFDMAKNIGTCVIGILVVLGAIYGYVAPGLVYLTLGTMVLVTEVLAIAIQQIYNLNFKDCKLIRQS